MENKVLQTADVSIEEMIEKLQKVSGGRGSPWMQWRRAVGFHRAPGPAVSLVFLMAVYIFQGTVFEFSEGGHGRDRKHELVIGGNSAEAGGFPQSGRLASDGI